MAALIGKWVRLLPIRRMLGTQPQRASGEGARHQSSAALPAFLCAISETSLQRGCAFSDEIDGH